MTSGLAEPPLDSQALDQLSIDTLRLLAVDTVEKAKSGHPGAPLGCAPIAYLLYHKLMKHNPSNAKWADRDRFVLSKGHSAPALYAAALLTVLAGTAGVLVFLGVTTPAERLRVRGRARRGCHPGGASHAQFVTGLPVHHPLRGR